MDDFYHLGQPAVNQNFSVGLNDKRDWRNLPFY